MLRIKKLDIFILRQFSLLFCGTFCISLFVLMMQFLWKFVDELIGKGLTLDIMGQLFWYMGLMFVPQALPLALLLSSLITFGNLGESSELTAIKAAGISLMQTFRSLVVFAVVTTGVSFIFQNQIGPIANQKMAQLFISVKQKSPELEIPEGIFYSGIPNCNLYVQKKDMKTGKLYGIMIYRMTASYEDHAIILADSGMLQSTAEKKHLLLTLWSGEWFENMQTQSFGDAASVPYRRETFTAKRIVLDFDGDFSLMDASSLSNNAKGKSLAELQRGKDSLTLHYDSVGADYMDYARMTYYRQDSITPHQRLAVAKIIKSQSVDFDSVCAKLSPDARKNMVNSALSDVQSAKVDLDVQVAKLKVLRGDFQNQKYRLEDKLLKTFPEEIQKQKTRIAALQQDSQIAAAHPQDKENFCGMTIKGMVYDDKKAAGERLLLARQEMPNADMMLLGTYRGFELNIRFDSFKNEHQAVLRAELSYPVSLGDDARGNITRLDNAIDNFADRIADAENALQNLEQQKQAAEVEVAKPFAQEEELAEKSARLAELNALLNIDRDRSSSQDAPEETEETETPATRPSVLAALGEKINQSEPVKPFRSYYDKDGDAR